MAIRKSTIINQFKEAKKKAKGLTRSTLQVVIECIRDIPEDDHSETIAGLEEILEYSKDQAKTWPCEAGENPWAKDVKILEAAIAALKKEEE